jgi:cysteinyl-tRNA synthetase
MKITMRLFNTLSKSLEEFKPIKEGAIGVYSCGPTVYWNQHIGHMYAYVQWDILVRFLRYSNYDVKWVMNVTDVGHMTGENEGNPDVGEDKMEKGAKREGVSVWELADRYIKQFTDSLDILNVKRPDVLCRATEHIPQQIALIEKIVERGFAYQTKRGVVFDTSKFPGYADFASLDLAKQIKGEDEQDDPEKKHPSDFFLWAKNDSHLMLWDSPWGKGYPGWHIECTAMSVKYLGERFDIHTGGIEHIGVHHTNEIAQGFGAFGDRTANYWLHNAHLMGKGGVKMSKSLGNFVTAQELVDKGYDPLGMRYLILNSHYHKGMNFSYEALDGAQTALNKLRKLMGEWRENESRETLSQEKNQQINDYRERFIEALSDDLNIPQALAVTWEVAKSNIPSSDKYDLILNLDEVLGLNLGQTLNSKSETPNNIKILIAEREKLRAEGKYAEADAIRDQLQKLGFAIQDKKE